MSYPIWGKGTRGQFSKVEFETQANIARTHTWQTAVMKGLSEGNVGKDSIKVSRNMFGTTIPACRTSLLS